MQVQDDPRAGRARRGERAPAQRRLDVVGVDDARAGALDGVGDLGRAEAAEQQPAGRVARRESAAESRSRTSASSPSSVRISQARSSTARSSPPGTR